MKRNVMGVILATLAVYVWGMIYWAANPLPYTAWKKTKDDRAAGQALLDYFPESGTYYLPGMYNDEETISRLYEAGPVAFVHVTSREGRPMHETAILVKGFFLYLVTATLIAAMLRQALPGVTSYGRRVKLVALAGLAASVAIHFGDAVWWYIPWPWKIHQALYDFSAWVVMGLVLANFVRPFSSPAT